MTNSRREFIHLTARAMAGGVSMATVSPRLIAEIHAAGQALTGLRPEAAAVDEAFWATVAQSFHLDGRYVILNGGGQNPPTRAVVDALVRYEAYASAQPRPNNVQLLEQIEHHRRRLAEHLSCDPDELAITRNMTEGLNIVAQGLDFNRGDEVLVSSFDREYAARALRIRESRHGVLVRELSMPVPCRDDEVVERFGGAITPRTRLIAVSHVADGFGFVLPIRRLSQLAHQANIPVLSDGALAFGHVVVDSRPGLRLLRVISAQVAGCPARDGCVVREEGSLVGLVAAVRRRRGA
jgi:isopenicillin-N epimerase